MRHGYVIVIAFGSLFSQITPLLYMDEVDYDVAGRPILYARQFYADGIIRQTLMRKKI